MGMKNAISQRLTRRQIAQRLWAQQDHKRREACFSPQRERLPHLYDRLEQVRRERLFQCRH